MAAGKHVVGISCMNTGLCIASGRRSGSVQCGSSSTTAFMDLDESLAEGHWAGAVRMDKKSVHDFDIVDSEHTH